MFLIFAITAAASAPCPHHQYGLVAFYLKSNAYMSSSTSFPRSSHGFPWTSQKSECEEDNLRVNDCMLIEPPNAFKYSISVCFRDYILIF